MNAKVLAARRNALRSTGPRTADGKATASQNARRHGLLATAAVLPGEDRSAFRELATSLRGDLRPVGALEDLLVDRVAATMWRLQRAARAEAEVLAHQLQGFEAERADRARHAALNRALALAGAVPPATAPGPATEETFPGEAIYTANLRAGSEARAAQTSDACSLGRAFIHDAAGPDALSKVARYEASIERAFYRALHELQRLQASRAGLAVPPPVALDIDVSVGEGPLASGVASG